MESTHYRRIRSNTVWVRHIDAYEFTIPATAYSNVFLVHFDKINKLSLNWRWKIKAEKSVSVPFTLRKQKKNSNRLHFQFRRVLRSNKYPGIIFNKKLTKNSRLKAKCKALNSQLYLLRTIFKSKLFSLTKMLKYKSLLRFV